MSIQTTIDISRDEAVAKAITAAANLIRNIPTMSDEEIEDLIDEQFYNYKIVS